jgi:hypothetical protein
MTPTAKARLVARYKAMAESGKYPPALAEALKERARELAA